MKHTPRNPILRFSLPLLALAMAGTGHAATILSSETWDGATFEYSNTGVVLAGWVNPSSTGGPVGGTDPGGEGGLVRNSPSSYFTLTNPLSLASGGYASVEISYSYYARDLLQNSSIQYSALGDFSDTVTIKVHPTSANSGGATPINSPYEIGRWYIGESITLTPETVADADPLSVAFTDTAKIRLAGGTNATGNNHWAFYDNVVITGIPEPASALLGGLGALMLLRRRRTA